MKLYDKYTSNVILIGISLYHVLALSLSAFFCYRFLIQSYDPTVYLLLLLLIAPLIIMDILLRKDRMFKRFLIRCKFNEKCIFCYGLLWKSWEIPWSEISTYGITGYAHEDRTYPIIFFSLDSSELYEKNKIFAVNQQRVVFQMREEIWPELSEFMPDDMKKQLRYSIDSQRNCFCKRRVVN